MPNPNMQYELQFLATYTDSHIKQEQSEKNLLITNKKCMKTKDLQSGKRMEHVCEIWMSRNVGEEGCWRLSISHASPANSIEQRTTLHVELPSANCQTALHICQ